MIEYVKSTKFGDIIYLIAEEGKKILVNNDLVSEIAVCKGYDINEYVEVIDSDYIAPDIPVNENEVISNVTQLQENQIKLSKINLAKFLEDNPMYSQCKYTEGRYYNVTNSKQQQLADKLLKSMLFNDYKPTWNDTGNVSEVWTVAELQQLYREMDDYVSPLVELQREVELRLKECTSQEEVLSIDINPYKEVAMKLEINTFN